MTLNQVITRIRTICLAHKQVRSFYRGFTQDFLADHTRKYPAVVMEETGGSISISQGASILNFRLSFWDLVNVASDTKINEQDVDSDMVSLALDIIAQLNYGAYTDWRLSVDNALQLVISEHNDDMYGGCTVDISLKIMFKQNICAIPTDITDYEAIDTLQKLVYDEIYVANGTEGTTLSIPAIVGKKILFISRENAVIYKTSSAPLSAEYTWNNVIITLGTVTNLNERFLILYRNY